MEEMTAAVDQVHEGEAREAAEQERLLADLSAEERERALQRFALLRPCLLESVSVAEVARAALDATRRRAGLLIAAVPARPCCRWQFERLLS